MTKGLNDSKKRVLSEAEQVILSLPSYAYFADEQDTMDSLIFGGYFVHRERLSILDQAVEAAKNDVGLPPETPIKASPPNTPAFAALRNLPPHQRARLREAMLAILDKVEAICFFSLVWKYDRSVSPVSCSQPRAKRSPKFKALYLTCDFYETPCRRK